MEPPMDMPMMAQAQEGVKLIKNSRGYNWEIKLLNLDLDELDRINKIMISKYGGGRKE